MRIALLTRRFDSAGGGTERDLIVTAHCLRAAGHQVTIFADEIRGATGTWDVRRVGSGPRLGRALSLLRFAWTAAPAARPAPIILPRLKRVDDNLTLAMLVIGFVFRLRRSPGTST